MRNWLSQGSRISPQCDVTRRHITHIVYITKTVAHQHAHKATFGLFPAARLFRETCQLRIRWIDIRGSGKKKTPLVLARSLFEVVVFKLTFANIVKIKSLLKNIPAKLHVNIRQNKNITVFNENYQSHRYIIKLKF